MSKQKIVIKVTMSNAKSRAQAMVLASKANGVVGSVEITGDDQLQVVGVGIDIVCLVSCLRKKLCCYAEIVKVEEVKDKKPGEKEKEKKPPEEPKPPCTCTPGPCRCAAAAGYYHYAPLPMYLCEQDPYPGSCLIL